MENQETPQESTTPLYVIIGVLAAASITYRLTQYSEFSNSSILFVGLPAILAILVINSGGTPKTTLGLVFKVITLFLLISSIILGEGIVCVLISAPIFYFVGFVIAKAYDYLNKKDTDKVNVLILVPIAVLLAQPLGINKESEHSVSASVTYHRPLYLQALAATPDLSAGLPTFLKIGFPSPQTVIGTGLQIGDQREIGFLSSTKGLGHLILEVEQIDTHNVRFAIASDNTHIGRWLSWKSINVHIDEQEGQSTITWTSDFACELGPQWYFEPIQKYAVQVMNEHLIQSYFPK